MCLGQTLSQPEGKESKAQKGKKCIQGPKLISGDGTLCQAFGVLYPIAVLANQNQDPGSLHWLSRSHRTEFLPGDLCLLGRWHPLELWQVVTHVAASTLSPQPTLCTHSSSWDNSNSSAPPLSLPGCQPAGVPAGLCKDPSQHPIPGPLGAFHLPR